MCVCFSITIGVWLAKPKPVILADLITPKPYDQLNSSSELVGVTK